MKKLIIIAFVFYSTLLFCQNELTWNIATNCNVYSSHYNKTEEIIFTAKAGDTIIPLQKYGNQDFKVKFDNGQIGWINFWDILQTLEMVVEDSIQIYTKPDYNSSENEYFKTGDTLVYLESYAEKEMVKVKSGNKTGWINEYYFISTQSKNFNDNESTDYIFDYDKFLKNISQLSEKEFEEKANTPEAKIIDNNYSKSLFVNIILVKDNQYYYNFYLIYKDGIFLKDSLIGTGRANWIEKIPLAGAIRKISPLYFHSNFENSRFSKYLEKIKADSKIIRIIAWVLKWIIVIILFSIPSILAYLTFIAIIRIKFLSNKIVKILNITFYILIFYIISLIIILNIGYVSPLFFIVFLAIPFGIITKRYVNGYNQKNIDRHRCNSCGSFKQAYQTGTVFISKKHDIEVHTWRENLGSSTSKVYTNGNVVNVTTNYYQNKSSSNNITLMYYNDNMKCKKCSSTWKVSRVKKEYGHI